MKFNLLVQSVCLLHLVHVLAEEKPKQEAKPKHKMNSAKPLLGMDRAVKILKERKLKFVHPAGIWPHSAYTDLKAKKEARLQEKAKAGQALVQSNSTTKKKDHECIYPALVDQVFDFLMTNYDGETTEMTRYQAYVFNQFNTNTENLYEFSENGEFIDIALIDPDINIYDYDYEGGYEDMPVFPRFLFCTLDPYEAPEDPRALPLGFAQCLEDNFHITADIDFLVDDYFCEGLDLEMLGRGSSPLDPAFMISGTSNFVWPTTTTTTFVDENGDGGGSTPGPELPCGVFQHPKLRVGDGRYQLDATFKDFSPSEFSFARIEGTVEILEQVNDNGEERPFGRFIKGRLTTPDLSLFFLCASHYTQDFFNCVLDSVGVAGRIVVTKFLYGGCRAEELGLYVSGRDDILTGQLVGTAHLVNLPPSPPPSLLSEATATGPGLVQAKTSAEEAAQSVEMMGLGFLKEKMSVDPPCEQGYPSMGVKYQCLLQTISGFDVYEPFLLNLTILDQLDTTGDIDFYGRFLEVSWDSQVDQGFDGGYCAFAESGEQFVCTMTLSRMVVRFTLEDFSGDCTASPQYLTMRGFSGGPFFNVSQGFGEALVWVVDPAAELTWKATCESLNIARSEPEPEPEFIQTF